MIKNDPFVVTASGRRLRLFDPDPDSIDIADVARSLSRLARFNGHTRDFYSVAEHSVLCSRYCHTAPVWGLLHDAGEAYLGDVITPLKDQLPAFRELEERFLKAIATRFDLRWPVPIEVYEMDVALRNWEALNLLDPPLDLRAPQNSRRDDLDAWFEVYCLPPEKAENLFLERFYDLKGRPPI